MKLNKIRTRFAPSPTGKLHVGGARTALFNYLYAKSSPQGKFILRIEDTDKERNEEEYIKSQYQDLCWLGIKPDESPFDQGEYGPYQQTLRLDVYQNYVHELLAKEKAYYCFCSKEELAKEKDEYIVQNQKSNYQYSRRCLQLKKEQIHSLLEDKKPYLLRLKIPRENNYFFHDLVRGEVAFRGKDIEDFVLIRQNGIPNYNFACVIDDHLMKISHVMRSEEHLSNTGKQLVLYQALGWDFPSFGHVSTILNKQKKKLSKRDKETSQWQLVSQLKEKGYLPEAITNYLLFLGWHPGSTNRELFSLSEAIEKFKLEGLHTKSAVYDLEKLNWYNNYYIQQLELEKFEDISWDWLKKKYHLEKEEKKLTCQIALLFRSQIKCFQDLTNLTDFFFQEPVKDFSYSREENELLLKWRAQLAKLSDDEWNEENIRYILHSIDKKPLLRKKLTGKKKGPELPKIIHLLGKEKTLTRLIL